MKHIWSIVTSIVALGIAIAIFHKAGSGSEKIVFSLLVMIYLRIATFEAWNEVRYYEGLVVLGKETWVIKKILQEGKSGFERFREEQEAKMARTDEAMDLVRLRVYLETGIASVTFFIALYHLLRGLQIF
jgi:hypothetical protein